MSTTVPPGAPPPANPPPGNAAPPTPPPAVPPVAPSVVAVVPPAGPPAVPPGAPPPITMPPPSKPVPTTHNEPGERKTETDELAGLRRAKAEAERRAEEAAARAEALQIIADTSAMNAVMAAEVAHPDVQRLFRSGYESYAAELRARNQSPVDFATWFKHDYVRQSPVYSPHFKPATPANPNGQPPPARPPVRVESGEQQGGPSGPSTITDAQIVAMSTDPVMWRANRERVEAHFIAKYGRNPFGKKATRK